MLRIQPETSGQLGRHCRCQTPMPSGTPSRFGEGTGEGLPEASDEA